MLQHELANHNLGCLVALGGRGSGCIYADLTNGLCVYHTYQINHAVVDPATWLGLPGMNWEVEGLKLSVCAATGF